MFDQQEMKILHNILRCVALLQRNILSTLGNITKQHWKSDHIRVVIMEFQRHNIRSLASVKTKLYLPSFSVIFGFTKMRIQKFC